MCLNNLPLCNPSRRAFHLISLAFSASAKKPKIDQLMETRLL